MVKLKMVEVVEKRPLDVLKRVGMDFGSDHLS